MSPSTAVLTAAVAEVLGPVAGLERRPSPWASTAALEDVRVGLADGTTRRLVLKSGGRATAHELAVYRDLLRPAALGTPQLLAGSARDAWLLLDAVQGAPLWQSAGVQDWCATAAWLRGAHDRLTPAATSMPSAAGRAWEAQLERAVACDPRVRALTTVHARAAAALDAVPATVVHGELFPANVLVAGDDPVVVDWETAGHGARLLDLAALCVGWAPEQASRIAQAYGGDLALLPAAHLVVAVRWLGEPAAAADAAGGYAARTDWWAEAARAGGLAAGAAVGTGA